MSETIPGCEKGEETEEGTEEEGRGSEAEGGKVLKYSSLFLSLSLSLSLFLLLKCVYYS